VDGRSLANDPCVRKAQDLKRRYPHLIGKLRGPLLELVDERSQQGAKAARAFPQTRLGKPSTALGPGPARARKPAGPQGQAMPVYEFLCSDCNRVFNFLARSPDAASRKPACPKCGGRRMSKLFSLFATARKSAERAKGAEAPPPDADLGPADEARMDRAMASLEHDMESIDENDPRQVAAAMRRLSDASGEKLGPEFDEMIRRIEAGEDPEKVEEEMGDLLGDDEAGGAPGGPPSRDDGLYDL
jgi:putative FmdB family regulatory protein